MKRKYKLNQKAQVLIEFTYAMIVAMLMLFSAVMLYRWSGLDLVGRQKAHIQTSRSTSPNVKGDPLKQNHDYWYRPVKPNVVFKP